MLVVISIIALLAAILFPVFARARENARRASCQSNLKQIGLGVLQYAQDSDDKLPPINFFQAYPLVVVQPYVKSYAILRCPSDWTPDTWGMRLPLDPTNILGPEAVCSYRMTRDSDGSTVPPSGAYWGLIGRRGISLSDIPTPVETIAIVEGNSSNDGVDEFPGNTNKVYIERLGLTPYDFSTPAQDATYSVTRRHFDGANYAFADGHVKWFARQVIDNDATGANATLNGVRYFYFWRKGVSGK